MSVSHWLQRLKHFTGAGQKFSRRRRHRNAIPATVSEGLETRQLLAAFSWNTDADGAWENPANWTGGAPGAIPGPADTVTINRGAANPTITVSTNVDISSLTSSENLILSAGRLKASGNISFTSSHVRWRAGTLQGASVQLTSTATLTTETTGSKTFVGHLRNSGTINWQSHVAATGAGLTTRFTNQTGGVWSVSAAFSTGSAILFTNSGTFRKLSGATTNFGSSDRFDHRAGSLIESQGGVLNLPLSGTATAPSTGATIHVAAGAVVNLNQGNAFLTGTYTGTGEGRVELTRGAIRGEDTPGGTGVVFNFAPGVFHWTGGNINSDAAGGDRFINAGTMQFSGDTNRTLFGKAFHNTGTIIQTGLGATILNTASGGAEFINDVGGLYEHRGQGRISGGTFTNHGVFRNTTGTVDFQSPLNLRDGSRLEATGGRLLISTSADFGNATIDVSAGAVVELNDDPVGTSYFRVLDGAILTGTGAGRIEFVRGRLDSVNNGGTINFADGLFHFIGGGFSRGITNQGYLTIPAGSTGQLGHSGVGATFRNEGVVVQQPGSTLGYSNIINQPGGLWVLQGNASLIGWNSLTNDVFSNAGLLRKTGAGDSVIGNNFGWLIHTGGTVEVLAGNLTTHHTHSSSGTGGTFAVSSGSVLNMTGAFASGGSYTGFGGGRVVSTARLIGSDDTFSLNFPQGMFELSTTGHAQATSGMIRNEGEITLRNTSEPIRFFSSLVNSGSIIQTSGTQVELGNFSTTFNHGLWQLQGDSTIALDFFDGLAAYFANVGTIQKSGPLGTSRIYSLQNEAQPVFSNSGRIEVSSGVLEVGSLNLKQFQSSGGILHGGEWVVREFSSLRIEDTNGDTPAILSSYADITLDGPASQFVNIETLVTNDGHMTLSGGRDLTLLTSLTNGVTRSDAKLLDGRTLAVHSLDGIALGADIIVTHAVNERVSGNPVFNVRSRATNALLRQIVQPGTAATTSALDLTTASVTIGGTTVPAGSLLFLNNQHTPRTLYAINPNTGATITSLPLPTFTSNLPGMALHPVRGTIYTVGVDAIVSEIDPSTGNVLASFPLRPAGSPSFGMGSSGGLEVDANGNLLVTSIFSRIIRQLSPTGQFLQDTDLTWAGMAREQLTGISIDDQNGEIWLSSQNGFGFRFSAIDSATPARITIGAGSEFTVTSLNSNQGTVAIAIADRPATGKFGTLNVQSSASFNGGEIAIERENGFAPLRDDQYPVATFGSLAQPVTAISGLPPYFQATVSPTSVLLTAVTGGIDLTALSNSMVVPAVAAPGDDISITYTARNLTTSALSGPWTDSIYLSRDRTLSADDLLLARHQYSGGVASLGDYSQTVTAAFPGLADGDWFALVVADSGRAMADPNRANNVAASVVPIRSQVNTLTLGVPTTGTIRSGEDLYFRLPLTQPGNVRLDLQLTSELQAEFYLRHGQIPNSGTFDQFAPSVNDLNPQLELVNPVLGSWYVLVRGTTAAGTGLPFTLTALPEVFSVNSIYPNRGDNSGTATVSLTGAGFTETAIVELVRGNGTVAATATTSFMDSRTLEAKFNLSGVTPASYTVRVTDVQGVVSASESFAVSTGNPGRLTFELTGTGRIRPQGSVTSYLEYTNVGGGELPAPLVLLEVTGGTVRLLESVNPGLELLPILAVSQTRGSIIAPGETNRIPVRVTTTGNAVSVQVHQMREEPVEVWKKRPPGSTRNALPPEPILIPAPDPHQPLWDELRTPLKPTYVSDEAWDAIYPNYLAAVGTDVYDYRDMLRNNADFLHDLGYDNLSISALDTLEFQRASNWGELVGRNYLGSMGRGIPDLNSYRLIPETNGHVRLQYAWYVTQYLKQPGTNRLVSANPLIDSTITELPDGWTLVKPDGSQLHFDAAGLLTRMEDAGGVGINVGYAAGRIVSLRADNGTQTTYQYNAAGMLTRIDDASEVPVLFTYDANNEYLIGITAGQTAIQISYVTTGPRPARHAVSSISFSSGLQMQYSYDSRGRVTSSRTSDNSLQVNYIHDDVRNTITEQYTDGTSYTYSVGLFGEAARIVDPLGGILRLSVDDNGFVSQVSSDTGISSLVERDSDGRVRKSVDASGNVTEFQYDDAGFLVALRDARGSNTLWTRTADNRPRSVVRQDGTTSSLQYDDRGNVTVSTNRQGLSTSWTYDVRDRLTRIDYPDATFRQFTYNDRDYLTSATNEHGTVSFEYDEFNNITRVTDPSGRFVQYTYDAFGRRVSTSDSSGVYFANVYDSLGRLGSVTDINGNSIVTYNFDSLGQLESILNANGTETQFAYDAAGRIIRQNTLDDVGQVLWRNEYTYDGDDRVIARLTNDGTWHFEHDSTGQLTNVTDPNGAITTYAYDAVGNRITTSGIAVTAYSTDIMNRYTSAGDFTFQYDQDGNTIQKSNGVDMWQYEWTPNGRLLQVTGPDGVFDYEYDALDQLIAVTKDGVRSEWVRDYVRDAPLSQYDALGNRTAGYVAALGLVAQIGAGNSLGFYANDALGNTLGITDPTGNILNSYEYMPFGEVWDSSETQSNPFQFSGIYGSLTLGDGLVKMGYRRYDASLGRFISEDPIAFFGGDVNFYRFALNQPTGYSDPTGLEPEIGAQQSLAQRSGNTPTNTDRSIDDNNVKRSAQAPVQAPATPPKQKPPLNAEPEVKEFSTVDPVDKVEISNNELRETPDKGLQAWRDQVKNTPKHPSGVYDEKLLDRLDDVLGDKLDRLGKIAKKAPLVGAIVLATTTATVAAEGGSVSNHLKNEAIDATPLGWPRLAIDLIDLNQSLRDLARPYLPDWLVQYHDIEKAGVEEYLLPGLWWLDREVQTWAAFFSRDPNDIVGPEGVGAERFMKGDELFPYLIRFENIATATAPAAEVFITQQLDNDLDWATAELDTVGFGDTVIQVPPGLQSWQTRLDLSSTRGIWLDIEGGIDPITGMAHWTFRSIDPLTGDLPDDPLLGFLPPNVMSPDGEGFVSYNVRVRPGRSTGTSIDAEARIVFDTNDPIDTPVYSNRIDNVAPSSQVTVLPSFSDSVFTVSWSGNDGTGSGIRSYDVYYTVNGGSPLLLMDDTTETSVEVEGIVGRTYTFFSVATDHLGQVEGHPATADASTQVRLRFTSPAVSTETVSPTFSWPGSSDAVAYDLWVDNVGTNQPQVIRQIVTGTSYSSPAPLGIGRFAAWFRIVRANGSFSAWSPRHDFAVEPRAEMLPMESIQRTAKPVIEWQSVPGAVRYDLWIDNLSTSQPQYIRDTNLIGTSWMPSVDLPIGSYKVWLRAVDAANRPSRWSFSQSFVVLPPPVVLTPSSSTFDRTPAFSWKPVAGATHYVFEARHPWTGALIERVDSIINASHSPVIQYADGPVRWWVRAVGPSGLQTYWSLPTETWIGGRPILNNPAVLPGGFVDFSWQQVDGAVRYDLWVNQLGGAAQIIREASLTSTRFSTSVALSAGTYRVWLRAISVANETSVWSREVDFVVAEQEQRRNDFGELYASLRLSLDQLQQPDLRMRGDLPPDSVRKSAEAMFIESSVATESAAVSPAIALNEPGFHSEMTNGIPQNVEVSDPQSGALDDLMAWWLSDGCELMLPMT